MGPVATDPNADMLNLQDVLDSNSGNVADYVYFTVVGTTATLNVDTSGHATSSAGGTALAQFTVAQGTTADSLLSQLLTNNQIDV